MSRPKKERMITISFTGSVDLVAKALSVDKDNNFSKFTREALEEKIKRIEDSKLK